MIKTTPQVEVKVQVEKRQPNNKFHDKDNTPG